MLNTYHLRNFTGKNRIKNVVRKEIGLPSNAIIFGNIGSIKPYKGLEFIINAFMKFSESQDHKKNSHLLIAGYSTDNEYVNSLRENYPKNITIINKDLNDTELIKFLSALDYSIFAFKDIWASGSVVLSISYKIPVIVPDIGCMPDYVKHSKNGYLYKSKDQNALIQIINDAMNSNNLEHQQQSCKEYARKYTIKRSEQEFFKIYKQVLNNKQSN